MSLKPFSEIVSDETEKKEHIVKPFVDKPVGGKVIEQVRTIPVKINTIETTIAKIINFLGSAQGFLSIFAVFIFVAVILNALQTLQSLLSSSSILDTIYLLSLTALVSTLGIITYRNYKQIKSLKNVKKIQELFTQQKSNPDKDIVPATLSLLSSYISANNETLKQKAQLLQSRISTSHDYKEIYKDLDEDVLNVIDQKVQEKIKIASLQAALSTAIAPLALLDSAIIIWRSVLLTKEIALLYGFKPGWLSTMVLLKHGVFNVFFAGVTELALEYANDVAESSLVSKISLSAGQGIANGILLARLGYGVMEACRPLPMRVKRNSVMKGIYLSIKDLIINTNEK